MDSVTHNSTNRLFEAPSYLKRLCTRAPPLQASRLLRMRLLIGALDSKTFSRRIVPRLFCSQSQAAVSLLLSDATRPAAFIKKQ